MAAGNKLTDYADVIVSTVIRSIPILLVLLLPAVLICIFGNDFPGFERFDVRFAGIVLGGCILCHILGIGVTLLPWRGDVTPAMLYRMDTNMNDQVEQLGLFTMLRLDTKHMIFPVKNTMSGDFSGIGTLTPPGGTSAGGTPPGTAPRPGSRCRWWTPPPTCWTSTWPPWRRAGRMTI